MIAFLAYTLNNALPYKYSLLFRVPEQDIDVGFKFMSVVCFQVRLLFRSDMMDSYTSGV